MDIVIDANILFAILIRQGKTEEILFKEQLHAYAPEFIFEEFEKHKETILEKTQRTEEDFNRFIGILKEKIMIVANEETDGLIDEARVLCPDIDDADYFALAIELRCPIWSNDKELKEKQKTVAVYSTEELAGMFP